MADRLEFGFYELPLEEMDNAHIGALFVSLETLAGSELANWERFKEQQPIVLEGIDKTANKAVTWNHRRAQMKLSFEPILREVVELAAGNYDSNQHNQTLTVFNRGEPQVFAWAVSPRESDTAVRPRIHRLYGLNEYGFKPGGFKLARHAIASVMGGSLTSEPIDKMYGLPQDFSVFAPKPTWNS